MEKTLNKVRGKFTLTENLFEDMALNTATYEKWSYNRRENEYECVNVELINGQLQFITLPSDTIVNTTK